MQLKNDLTESLHIDFPIIMAPMFLVSNAAMIEVAMKEGIMGVFPSLNFRKEGELETLIDGFNTYKKNNAVTGNFGMNLIVQKSNPLYTKHLKIAVDRKVPFYITSLGNPKEVIDAAHSYGAKVYCDVTNIEHAQKCYDNNCDGFIAVGQGAGGHAGPNPLQVLVPSLKAHFPDKPVVAAGGIANGLGIASALILGASGVSIGTRFIASKEANVNDDYKNAITTYKMDDIVMTTKLSGSPCTIINTDSAKQMGYEQNFIEKFLSNNPRTKKYFKMFVQLNGMKKMEQSILPNNYKKLWCAGKSVELIHSIDTCANIIKELEQETKEALQKASSLQVS